MSYHHGDWHSRQAVLSNSLWRGGGWGGYCRWRKQGLATIGQEQLSLCVLLYVKILHLMVPPGVLGNKRRRGYTNCILRDRKQCSICLGFSKWIYYIVQWGLAWYSFFNTDNYCKHGYPWQYTHNKQFAVLYFFLFQLSQFQSPPVTEVSKMMLHRVFFTQPR